MDYVALRNELDTDPLGRGYSTMTDSEAADDLNTVYRNCKRDTVGGWEIFNITDADEYDLLTDQQKASWDALCAIWEIETDQGVAKAREAELFGPGTQTRDNLIALRNPECSRAQELGFGRVHTGDVENARAL